MSGGGVSTKKQMKRNFEIFVKVKMSFQNWEFQIYDNTRTNSFCDKGILNIFPTLTEDRYGTGFVTSGTLDLNGGSPADEQE